MHGLYQAPDPAIHRGSGEQDGQDKRLCPPQPEAGDGRRTPVGERAPGQQIWGTQDTGSRCPGANHRAGPLDPQVVPLSDGVRGRHRAEAAPADPNRIRTRLGRGDQL